MWHVEDCTAARNGTFVGYLRLTLNGKRVADFFPYAPDSNPDWVREQAHKLAEYANKAEEARRR